MRMGRVKMTDDFGDRLPKVSQIFTIQFFVVLVSAAALAFVDRTQVSAFLAGAGLITLNFALLAKMWRNVLDKKPVARTIVIVVIKYAILGALLYFFIREMKLQLIPLFVGVSTLGGTFVLAALQTQLFSKPK